MKNIPSFSEFSKYDSLIESANAELLSEINELETADPYYTVNEGSLLDPIKNSISKFFLGSFSIIGMIDKSRKILVDLEIDVIEKRQDFEEAIDKIEEDLDGISTEDKGKRIALLKDRENKIKEWESYEKTQEIKIKKTKQFIQKAIGDSERRREYFEAGRSEDEVALAELEYELAKGKSHSSELKKYEDKIKAAKQDAEEKAKELEEKIKEAKAKKDEDSEEDEKIEKVDAEKEKKKISSRKAKDIIQRKNDLEKEIADIRYAMERKMKNLEIKARKSPAGIPSKYVNRIRIELLELSSSLDSKINLLKSLRELGKKEEDIEKVVKMESEFNKLTNKINKGVADGYDVKTGTKKIIAGVFNSTPEANGKSKVSPEKLKDAIEKINK